MIDLFILCRLICVTFFLIFFFRSPGQDNTEQIDISYYSRWNIGKDLLLTFRQSGFASASNESPYKLLPCSLGTFVKTSSKHPKCLECPAGNFSLIYDIRVTHLNRKDKHVHLEISVMIFSSNAKDVLLTYRNILQGVSLLSEIILRVQKSTSDVKKVSRTKYIYHQHGNLFFHATYCNCNTCGSFRIKPLDCFHFRKNVKPQSTPG